MPASAEKTTREVGLNHKPRRNQTSPFIQNPVVLGILKVSNDQMNYNLLAVLVLAGKEAPLRFPYRIRLRDLVVLIAVISILLAISFPLMQQIRESQRRTDCANRIRQTAVASHTFHDAYKRLPTGTLGFETVIDEKQWLAANGQFYWARAQQTSARSLLQPFCELSGLYILFAPESVNMYKFYDDFASDYSYFGEAQGAKEYVAAVRNWSNVLCPSDNLQEHDVNVILTSQPLYDAKTGEDSFGALKHEWMLKNQPGYGGANEFGSHQYALTNYVGNGGAHSAGAVNKPNYQAYIGPMSSRAKVTLDDIPDGTSTTFMYGESVGGINNWERESAYSWTLGGLARGRGDEPFMQPVSDLNGTMLGNARYASPSGFGSMHPREVNFANADCSVQAIDRGIDWKVFYQRCGMADGK